MASSDSTAIPDPSPEQRAGGSPTFGPATQSPVRLVYWSIRRELWEHRWIYMVPLIVAAVTLFGFAIGLLTHLGKAGSVHRPEGLIEGAFNFAAGVLMLTYMVATVIYCVGALHGERGDRSILFWKSLPVSDVTTVIAKVSIPLVVLPLMTCGIIIGTQAIMFLAGGAVLLGRGLNFSAVSAQISLPSMWAAMVYHLLTVHALYYAPFYGWLLLVSGWARRAAFLWAGLPVVAVLIIEKLVFNSSVVAHMLLSRLAGGPAAIPFPPPRNMLMAAPTLANLGAFLASPGLWIGFAICAVFLAAAVRLRRYQGPI